MAGLGQYELAADAFTHVTRIDPRDSSAWINLASCYSGLRQFQRSFETYQKAFALSPDDVLGMFVNAEYGGVLYQVGRASEAEAVFAKLAASPYPVARARGLRSMAFAQMYRGRYRQAVDTLREAIALNTEAGATVSAYRDRTIAARALMELNAPAEARREIAAATGMLAQQPFGPEWLFALVRMHARMGNAAEADRITAMIAAVSGSAVAASATNRNAAHDEGYLQLARAEVALARSRPADALAAATAATARLDRHRLAALDTLARAERGAGRVQQAAAAYAELIDQAEFVNEVQLDYFSAHIALAGLYEDAGRLADARVLYQRVAEMWTGGDTDLDVLKRARARLRALTP